MVVEVRHWGGNFAILVHQPHSEQDLEIGTASLVDDGFDFVIEVVVLDAITRGLAQVLHERVHTVVCVCANIAPPPFKHT